MGFEPTPLARPAPKAGALDHSATLSGIVMVRLIIYHITIDSRSLEEKRRFWEKRRRLVPRQQKKKKTRKGKEEEDEPVFDEDDKDEEQGWGDAACTV